MPFVNKDISIEVKLEKHLWQDSITYQFLEISIDGLYEVHPLLDFNPFDTTNKIDFNSLKEQDYYAGSYGAPILSER
jgi:hypothetical protein